jgi:hypothetical protein
MAVLTHPPAAQKPIAGVLGKPMRELFTDIPPDHSAKPPTQQSGG